MNTQNLEIQDFIVKTLVEKTKYPVDKIIQLLEDGKSPDYIIKSSIPIRKKLAKIQPSPTRKAQMIPERMEEKELEKVAPSTGFPKLDEILKGFIPGHLYLLTGQTNVGKTSLACNFAYHVAVQGKIVLYLALEPDNTVLDYLASISAKKRFDDVTEKDYDSIPDTIEYFRKDKVDTPEKLIAVLRERERYDLVIVDHIGYFISDTRNPYQTQSNVVKQLVAIAKERKCAILQIAHLRKSGVKKKKKDDLPTMDDISGSAAFKQDSTDVMIAIRTENDNDEFRLTYMNEGYILVSKTKSGPQGAVKIRFFDGGATVQQKEEEFKPF
jgi:replicative DNA helicase